MLGYLDDLILLPLFVALTIKFIPKNVMEQNRRRADEMASVKLKSKWYYAIPIVLIWLLLISLILLAFL